MYFVLKITGYSVSGYSSFARYCANGEPEPLSVENMIEQHERILSQTVI